MQLNFTLTHDCSIWLFTFFITPGLEDFYLDVTDVFRGHHRGRAEPEELVDANDGVHEEQDSQDHVREEREDGPEAEVGPWLAVHNHFAVILFTQSPMRA